jgi:phosphotransferase system  glucose/maltose/N-acetylglucosamine-specific IIC component
VDLLIGDAVMVVVVVTMAVIVAMIVVVVIMTVRRTLHAGLTEKGEYQRTAHVEGSHGGSDDTD